MTVIGELYIAVKPLTDGFNSELDSKLKGATGGAGGAMGGLAKIGVAAVAAVVAAGAASVDLANKFQSATAQIAASADISVGAANKISAAFQGTAGTTEFSSIQIANAFAGVAGQVKLLNGGILTASASMTVMKAAMDLATATGGDLNSTTADITKTLQAFSLGISDSPLVSNVLFNAARDTGNSVDSLTQSLTRVRAQMGAGAQSIQTMGGLLVDLAEHGAGTSGRALMVLGATMTSLLAPSTATTAEQVAFLGHSLIDAKGNLEPLNQIIGDVGPKIKGMGEAAGVAELKALGFGSGANKLYATIAAGQGPLDAATAGVAKIGSAHDAAAKKATTLKIQLETMKATLTDLGVKVGQALLPVLEKFGGMLAKVVGFLVHNKTALEAVAVVFGVVMVAGLTAAAAAAWAFVAPFVPIIAIIGALVFAGIELKDHWKQIWGEIVRLFDDAKSFIKSHLKEIEIALGIAFLPLVPLVILIVEVAKHWREAFEDIKKIVGDFVGILSHAVSAAIEPFKKAWDGLSKWWRSYWGEISDVLNAVWAVISAIISTAMGIITAVFQTAWDVISDIFKIAFKAIETIVSIFWPIISGYFKAGFNVLKGIVTAALDIIKGVFKIAFGAITVVVRTAFDVIKAAIKVPLDIIKGVIQVFLDLITGHWSRAWHDLANTVKDIGKTILGAVRNVFANITGFILGAAKTFLSTATHAGMAIIKGIVDGLNAAWSAVVDFFVRLPSKLYGFFKDAAKWLLNAGKKLIEGLIKGAVEAPLKGLESIGKSVLGKVKGIFHVFSPSTHPDIVATGKGLMDGIIKGMADNADATKAIAPLGAIVSKMQKYMGEAGLKTGVTFVNAIAEGISKGANAVTTALSKVSTTLNIGGEPGGATGGTKAAEGHVLMKQMIAVEQKGFMDITVVTRSTQALLASALQREVVAMTSLIYETHGGFLALSNKIGQCLSAEDATLTAMLSTDRLMLNESKQQTVLLKRIALDLEKPLTTVVKPTPGTPTPATNSKSTSSLASILLV